MLMALPVTALAQIAGYSSRVVDAETGEPLPMATIQGTKESTVANVEGQFRMKAAAGDVLKISYIGYKSVSIKAADIKSAIRLHPADIQLKEVTVKSFTPTIEKVIRKSVEVLDKYGDTRSNFLYRQTTEVDGVPSSMVEAFFNASSCCAVSDMKLITGSYSERDKQQNDGYSHIANFYPFSQMQLVGKRKKLWRDEMVIPLFEGYRQFYDTDHEVVDDGERKIFRISFKAREPIGRMMFEGQVFVDAKSYRLLMAKGKISNVRIIKDFGAAGGEKMPADVQVTIMFNEKSRYGEVQTVMVDAKYGKSFADYRFRSILYNVGKRNVGKVVDAKGTTDLRKQIEAIGYNKQFWKDNEVVKRTAVEAELARLRDGQAASENKPSYTSLQYNIRRFVEGIDRFNRYFPQEKVYLHFDNTGYFLDEKIWFKAYVMRADHAVATNLSKILYVELVNPSGDVVHTGKLRIENGQADGHIPLDNIYSSGFYEVRAYTRYMTNWGTDAVFSRVFPIFNKPQKAGDYSKPKIDEYSHLTRLPDNRVETLDDMTEKIVSNRKMSVRFYPEGGHLVCGIMNRVAYDVTGTDGMPMDTEGLLLSGEDTVGVVKTIREGRGWFYCCPESSKPLSLFLSNKSGKPLEFPLPEAEQSGIALQASTDDTSSVRITLNASADYQGKPLGVVLTHNGGVKAFQSISMAAEGMQLNFAVSELSDGVNRLSIISAEGDVLADRLFFVYPKSNAAITLSSDIDRLRPYGKVAMTATTLPETTFSLSVRDAATEINGSNGNCMTWLLLSSDLKGYINDVGYYFESNDLEHRRAADLLMMVQGWRRYNLRQMTGKENFKRVQPIERELAVAGKLNQAKKKFTVDDVRMKVTMFNQAGQSMSGSLVSNKEGKFTFNLPECFGDWRMFISTKKNDEDADYFVSIDRNFSPLSRKLSVEETRKLTAVQPFPLFKTMVEEQDDYIDEDKGKSMTERTHHLKGVTVKKKRGLFDNAIEAWESETQGQYWSSIYYDVEKEAEMIADRGEAMPSFAEWLVRRNSFFLNEKDGRRDSERAEAIASSFDLANLDIMYKNRPIFWIINNLYRDASGLSEEEYKALNALNEKNMKSLFELPSSMDEVKSVYISESENAGTRYLDYDFLQYKRPVFIFLYMYRKFGLEHEGQRKTNFSAYDTPEIFKALDYSVLPKEPDHRRTLYWNPNVKTDKDGKAKVEFYNNSSCKQVVISAEGITTDGRAMVLELKD